VTDRNFDTLASRLENRVYKSVKGKLRLEILWDDIRENLNLKKKKLTVLDAGGGFGKVSALLAEMGHDIVLCDISSRMLEKAESILNERQVENRVALLHSAFQDLPHELFGQFDLVLFHAVLEWLEKPLESLEILMKFIKPGGHLSLLYYNESAFLFYNALKGNFQMIHGGEYAGDKNSLTPTHPMNPEDIDKILEVYHVKALCKTGVRIFYDYMRPEIQKQRTLEDILEMEKKFCRKEPFVSMGRYIHTLGKLEI